MPKLIDEILPRRSAYPAIEPYGRGRLKVSDLHELFYEECGNPKGKPVVILHGGPGGGISPFLRRLHDPAHYRMILFDQRGCGNSTPHACLIENTTWHLVEDMERLRMHLHIDAWQVFGGSWGSTLALAYAQSHPQCVTELILRGIFGIQQREVDWLYQDGASRLFPAEFESFASVIPPDERDDLLQAYHRRLTGPDEAQQLIAARAWSRWEAACLSLIPDAQRQSSFGEDRFALAFAGIECHYFVNKGFMSHDGALLDGMKAIQNIPGIIVQGRYDAVTPPETAYALATRWPAAELCIVADAGHTAMEPGITNALVRATDRFSRI